MLPNLIRIPFEMTEFSAFGCFVVREKEDDDDEQKQHL